MKNLTKVEQLLFDGAYNFALKCGCSETESKKQAVRKISSVRSMINEKQTYVDLVSGERFICTENELEGMYS